MSDSDPAKVGLGDAEFVLALRAVENPDGAVTDSQLRHYRGLPLAQYDQQTRSNIEKCRSIEGLELDIGAVKAMWSEAMVKAALADCARA